MSSETVKSAKEKTSGARRQRTRPRSTELFERGKKTLVGGVDSPVRAFRAVGGTPLVIDHAAGTRLYDVDGREYLDYVCSWGALILGHAHPDVVAAVSDQAGRGTSYGMTSPLEIELGEKITRAVPSVEMVRFVSSGTEAAMSAVRLARAFTERDMVIKFEGCYHGHSDGFLSEAGSGLATLGIAACPGVPEAFARLTLNTPYNDLARSRKTFSPAHREDRCNYRGTGGREYGSGGASRGISGRVARNLAEGRRAADFRRGDYRIPHGLWRGASRVWN